MKITQSKKSKPIAKTVSATGLKSILKTTVTSKPRSASKGNKNEKIIPSDEIPKVKNQEIIKGIEADDDSDFLDISDSDSDLEELQSDDDSSFESEDHNSEINSSQVSETPGDDSNDESDSSKDDCSPVKDHGHMGEPLGSGEEIPSDNLTKDSRKRRMKDKRDNTGKKPTRTREITDSEVLNAVRQRLDERQKRTLYIKGKIQNFEISRLFSLVPGICDVRKKFKNAASAYLEFRSAEDADKACKRLQKIKIENEKLVVDFTGNKNKQPRQPTQLKKIMGDPLTLYVGGLAASTKLEDVKAAFPTSSNIHLPLKKSLIQASFAIVKFKKEAEAYTAFIDSTNKVINGKLVTVMFAKEQRKRKKKRRGSRRVRKDKIGSTM